EIGVTKFAKQLAKSLKSEFKTVVDEGLLEIIIPNPTFYPPDLDRIEPTLGDSADRMKWRTKQNLDFAYLMMYCQNRGTFYIQLEDDVITKPNYLKIIKG
uniref:MGAT4 conserved region domain-containing protein n=1 Tax=Romanomermis culicivorax TaxID=13658 RepID=A0A915HH91_ROMCU